MNHVDVGISGHSGTLGRSRVACSIFPGCCNRPCIRLTALIYPATSLRYDVCGISRPLCEVCEAPNNARQWRARCLLVCLTASRANNTA